MNENKTETGRTLVEDMPEDALRLEYSIRLLGGHEVVCDFSNSIEIPMGMRTSHLNSAFVAIGHAFEHCIEKPTMIAARCLIERRMNKAREGASKRRAESYESKLASPISVETGTESNSQGTEWSSDLAEGDKLSVPFSLRSTADDSSQDARSGHAQGPSRVKLSQAA